MKKVLIITAHPSSAGHTHTIARAYEEASVAKGNMIEILDLYKTELQLPFLSFENVREMVPLDARSKLQSKILWADELVFIHPLWWGWMPAIMKNFIDQCFETKFAFVYENKKPKGLLGPRHAKVFMTSGAPAWLYMFFLSPFKTLWRKIVLEFCGIKLTHIELLGSMAPVNEKRIEKFLKKVKSLA